MFATRTGSKRLLRDLNRSIVLNLIADQGALSRTDLVRLSGLPAATITRIVGDFLAAQLIAETTVGESSGGRRPILLRVNPAAGHVVGLKLREDSMTVAVCDLSCTVIYQCEATLSADATPDQAVETIAAAVEACIGEAGIARASVLGVGVGLSGLIDSTLGLCRYSAILGWRDVALGPALEAALHLRTHVDNDVNTLAVVERQFGVGRTVRDFALVTVGRGIGLGLVVGGEIYRGSSGGAGEFGHVTVDMREDAPLCNCGKRGCLEAIASDYGILRAALGADPGHHVEDAMEAVLERARSGDRAVQEIFTRAGMALGVAVANLINIFDPALVLIGGEGLRAGELLERPIRTTAPRHVFGRPGEIYAETTRLVFRPTTEVEWARGAASLVLREMFRPPIYKTEGAPVIETLLAAPTGRR